MAEIKSGSKLTDEQRRKITEWTQTVGKGGPGCCFCGNNVWTLLQEMVQVPVFQGSQLMIGGQVVPAFMLVCDICGHLELISAVKAGLVEGPKPTEAQKKEEPNAK